jgi:DNA-binding GntR family transcriptional regulator
MPAPKPLNSSLGRHYKSLNELVYQQLRDQILWGKIPPGSMLSVRKLSERLAVSPMPVRDALRRLATDELVEVSPRSSTRVTQVSPEGVQEMSEVRSCVESRAAALAVAHLTPADNERLKSCLKKLEDAASQDRPEEWIKWNRQFHLLMYGKCGNTLLRRMAQDLWERNLRQFTGRAVTQAGFRRRRSKEHRRILRAILRRDPEATEAAWRHHVYQSGMESAEYLRRLMSQTPASNDGKPPGRRSGRI